MHLRTYPTVCQALANREHWRETNKSGGRKSHFWEKGQNQEGFTEVVAFQLLWASPCFSVKWDCYTTKYYYY